MEEKKNSRAYISIETDIGKKKFHDLESLIEWVEQEEEFWRDIFATRSSGTIRNIFQKWGEANQQISTISESERKPTEKKRDIKSAIETKFNKREIISSINPIVDELKECKHNNEADGFIEGYQNSYTQNIKNDHLRLIGYIKGKIFSEREHPKANSENRKIDKLIAQWSEKNEELLASLEQHKDEHEKLLDALTTSQSDNLETLRLTKNSFNQAILGLKHAFDDFLKDANQSLESVRETYRKHMSLRASVDYWSDQANEHEQKAKRAFTWLIIFTLVTIFTFLFAGALIVLSATPEDLNGSAFNLSYGHAIKGLVAALLLSFLIWSIKLSNKTWHIHKHLHQDAKERVTMMKTYLALASEEKNLRENDVELILNSLFRPAYDGIIKDDTAPRSLMDFIMRDNK